MSIEPPILEASTILAALLKGGRPVAQEVMSRLRPDDMLDDTDKGIFSACALKANYGDYTYDDIRTLPSMQDASCQQRILSMRSVPWTIKVVMEDCVPVVEEFNFLRLARFLVASIHDGIQFGGWSEQQARDAINDLFERSNASVLKRASANHVSHGLKQACLEVMGKGTLRGELMGIRTFDNLLNGLRAGELTYIAARPGAGKTAFMIEYALNVAKRGKQVLFVSAEMRHAQLQHRMICNMARIDSQEVRQRGGTTAAENTRIIQAGKDLLVLPITIYEAVGVPVDEVCAYVSAKTAQGKVDICFVDYLQDLQAPSNVRKEGIERETTYLSKAMRHLCATTRLPMAVAVQLSRGADNNRPTMRDLRGSGQIEMDAWNIVALHKPEQTPALPGMPEILEVELLKQRDGAQGREEIAFDKRYGRFGDYTSQPIP